MCGLFGFADRRVHMAWDDHLQAAVESLSHRGPDDEGRTQRVLGDHCVGLGHRRLSIRDLSTRGRQPFTSEDGKTLLVCNGEIYNADGLRAELEDAGHRFASRSDSEVILHGYEEYGAGILERLDGMFAFAILDAREGMLFLARDRLGIKPLLVAKTPGGIAFGSELRGLLEWPGVSPDLCPHALHEFLAFGYVLAPNTIVRGIRKLRPGHFLRYRFADGSVETQRYWSLEQAFRGAQPTEVDPVSGFWDQLHTAVEKRLVADVPVGAYLSGGLDSSAISTVAAGLSPGMQSFCCEFSESNYSEGAEARRVADAIGTRHRGFVMPPPADADLGRLVRIADEPLADTSFVACDWLAARARENATVVLSGDGADELLAGYATYRADRYHGVVRRLPLGVRQWLADRVAARIPSGWSKVGAGFRTRQFLSAAPFDAILAHTRWRTLWWPHELDHWLDPGFRAVLHDTGSDPASGYRARFAEVSDLPFLQQSLYVDLSTWLVDDILAKVDRSSMAHGLEVRVPFLDHRLVEWCAPLSPGWKLANGSGKRILRQALARNARHVPAQARKQGFNAPVGHWLNGALAGSADRLLADAPELGRGWFAGGPGFERLLEEHRSGRSDHGVKLWSLVWILEWVRQTGARLAEPAVTAEAVS